MKTVSSALAAALGAPVQRPAVLVEAAFASTRRWSSFATINWGGNTWTAHPISVDGLQIGALQLRGSLVIDNRDGEAGALVLAEGVQDRVFRLWAFDAAATATADVVWLADAIGSGVQVSPASVAIDLRHRAELLVAPRQFATENLLGPMLPLGSVVRINGQELVLNRRGGGS